MPGSWYIELGIYLCSQVRRLVLLPLFQAVSLLHVSHSGAQAWRAVTHHESTREVRILQNDEQKHATPLQAQIQISDTVAPAYVPFGKNNTGPSSISMGWRNNLLVWSKDLLNNNWIYHQDGKHYHSVAWGIETERPATASLSLWIFSLNTVSRKIISSVPR